MRLPPAEKSDFILWVVKEYGNRPWIYYLSTPWDLQYLITAYLEFRNENP